MQAFNASDVIYSQRVAPLILKGLKDDGIAASYDGTAGEQVLPYADFLPDISWMSPAYVAGQLGASASSGRTSGTPAPGLHGHQIDSVSVNGVDLTTDGSNRIAASAAADVHRQLHERRRERRDERQGDGRDRPAAARRSERRRSSPTRPPARPRLPTCS